MKQLSLDHNHAVDSHTFSLYPQQRQPTGPVLQQAQEMLTTGSNPTLVTNFLHNQQHYVKPRDMYNLKYQLKFKGTPMEELQNVLDKPGITFDITKDANNVLQCVSFCSEQQKLLASKYGGVVLLDGTYRINKLRMPLYTLAVVDADGHGQPVAHALLAREDSEHIGLFLNKAKGWFANIAESIFIVDKDHAEIRAISQVFPDAAIHLCRFHVCKAFTEEMKQQKVSNDRELYQVLTVIRYW